MLQDFNFKILHRPRSTHSNVDALSRNHVGGAKKMKTSMKKSKMSDCYKN
jgi:hypothetical protein